MRAWVVSVSVALHVAALATLLPWTAKEGGGPVETAPVEVELVQRPDTTPGAQPTTDTPVAAASAAEPMAAMDGEAAPQPAASAAMPDVAAHAAPAVNLGNSDREQEGIDVTGRGVVPPGPDSAFRNKAPAYPIEAARVGAQGTVVLLVHVSALGVAQDVTISASSGSASLDRAARNAVRRWRFTPARRDGAPVPFDYPLDIRFVLGDRP